MPALNRQPHPGEGRPPLSPDDDLADLLHRARVILGTESDEETIRHALCDVIRRHRHLRHLEAASLAIDEHDERS